MNRLLIFVFIVSFSLPATASECFTEAKAYQPPAEDEARQGRQNFSPNPYSRIIEIGCSKLCLQSYNDIMKCNPNKIIFEEITASEENSNNLPLFTLMKTIFKS